MECCCYLRNAQDLLADGAEVNFFPTSAKGQGRVYPIGTEVLPVIFIE